MRRRSGTEQRPETRRARPQPRSPRRPLGSSGSSPSLARSTASVPERTCSGSKRSTPAPSSTRPPRDSRQGPFARGRSCRRRAADRHLGRAGLGLVGGGRVVGRRSRRARPDPRQPGGQRARGRRARRDDPARRQTCQRHRRNCGAGGRVLRGRRWSRLPAGGTDQAFERFYRGDPSRSGSGSGLGLAIVRELARAHGGVAIAENLAPHGARVSVILPVSPPFGVELSLDSARA